MPFPDLLPSLPPSLSEQLRFRTNSLRSKIVRTNYNTHFAQTARELLEFRHVTAGLVNGVDDDILSESFQKTVHFTTYDSYAPLVARFSEKPLKASSIVDLFAPGLPDCLSESSSTSGGLAKTFPKYNSFSKIGSPGVGSFQISDPLRKRTSARVCYLGCDRLDVEDENNRPAAKIYLTFGSVIRERVYFNLDPENDEERMGTFILDHTAPYATGFIKKWRSFLLIHALFAVGSRSLETMRMPFINTFVDMIRHLDMEFDMIVDCIANGTIPDIDGIAEVRHYLEPNISPDLERAAELHRLGRPSSRPGWCGQAWPKLRSITAIASGSFASSLPLAQWFLDPNTNIHAYHYATTETSMGSPYNPLELNLFKPNDKIIMEFLDINNGDSTSALAQIWEVELGKRYEPVVTTPDGLWRYRFGDVVEVAGFDPTDGDPIIQFVERRNVALRFPDFMVTEKELRAAILSMEIKIVNWTTTMDDRRVPDTIGFFVESADEDDIYSPVSELVLAHARDRVFDELLRSNANIVWSLAHDVFRKPTIRLVRPGTFSEFLQLKLDEGSNNRGQIKVPVVLPKAEYVEWFVNRVMQEL